MLPHIVTCTRPNSHAGTRDLTAAIVLLLGLARTALNCPSARAQVFTGLGSLPGEIDSLGMGVSADGSVVVGAAGSGGNYHRAFRWTSGGGMEDIGVAGLFAFAHAVSADGAVVVGVGDPDGGGNSAFRWTFADGMVRLGTL